jgi:hypothetical protein
MAKRKTLKRDDFDIDNDLDFNEFDFGDNDALINKDVSSKKRNPVMDVFKGTITGVKDTVKNPNFLAQTVKDSLPEQYGTVFQTADEVVSTATSLYDEAIREIKPQLSRVAKKIDRLVPEERKILKKITSKFKDLVGDETGDFKGQSKEQLQEQAINNSIASVFQQQAEKDQELQARAEASNVIKETIDTKRFNSNFGLLSSINEQVTKLGNYNEKINQAFQKKSLELQFRSYFTQAELLDTTKKFFDVFQKQNEAIAKNTALPEFVKIKNSERFKEIGYNKLYSGFQESLFGTKGLFGKGLKALKGKLSSQISGFKQGLEAGLMGLDQLESMKELNQSMTEAGGEGINPSEMAGSMAGSGLANYARNKASGFMKKHFEKDDKPWSKWLNKTGYKLATAVLNPARLLSKFRNSDKIQDNIWKGGWKGFLARIGDDLLSSFSENGPNTKLVNRNNPNALHEPGIFNNKTKISIEEIIPGYLSMIHRELIITRTGNDNAPQSFYDFTSGKFKSSGSIKESIHKQLSKTAEESGQSGRLNDMFDKLFKNENVKVKDQISIKEFLMNLVPERNIDFGKEDSIEKIKKTKAFQQLDKETGELILRRLDELTSQNNENKDKNVHDISSALEDLRERSPNFSGNLQQLLDQGYGNQLEEMGLVSRTDSGDFKINIDKHQEIVKESVIKSSNTGNRDTYVIAALIKNAKENGLDQAKLTETITKLISEDFGKDLVKLGIIDKNTPKGFKINFPTLGKILKDNGYADSDINVKRNINLLKPKDALTALKKTRIYNWFYKHGKGDQKKKIGPMAQDVNKNIGEQASANGKNIDLVTMNGVNMAAIKAVDDRQSEQQKEIEQLSTGSVKKTEKNPVVFPDKQDPILAIKTNTDKLVELMEEGNKFVMKLGDLSGMKEVAKNVIETAKEKTSKAKEYVTEKGAGYKESIGNLARSATELVIKGSGDLMTAIGKTFTTAKNTATAIGGGLTTVITDLYKTNKDKAMNAIGGLFGAGANLATKVINSATDVLFNKLPAGMKQIAQVASWAKNKVVDYFDQPLDVYIKGLETPALRANLMKMGYYLDQSSGKPIMNIRDLMRIKGNIVNKEGNIVLTMEDMKDGLFDKAGKPISTFISKLAKTAISAGVAGILRGKDAILKSMKIGKATLQGAGDFIKNKFNFKDRVKNILSEMPQFSLPNLDMLGGKSTEILEEIRDILKERLGTSTTPGTKGKVKPSQRIQARQDKAETNAEETKAEQAKLARKEKITGVVNDTKNKGKQLFRRAVNAVTGNNTSSEEEFVGPIKPIKETLKDKALEVKEKALGKLGFKSTEELEQATKDTAKRVKERIDNLYKGNTSANEEFVGPVKPIKNIIEDKKITSREYWKNLQKEADQQIRTYKAWMEMQANKKTEEGESSEPTKVGLKDKAKGFFGSIKDSFQQGYNKTKEKNEPVNPDSTKEVSTTLGKIEESEQKTQNIFTKLIARFDKFLKDKEEGKSEGPQTTEETTSAPEEPKEESSQSAAQPQPSSGGGSGIISKGMQLFGNLKGGLANAKSAKGIKGKALAVLGGLFGGSKGSEESKEETPASEQPKQEQPVKDETKKGLLSRLKDKVTKKVTTVGSKIKSAFNDKDNSGKRDGSWEDRLKKQEELKNSRNNGVDKASLDQKYRGKNVIDTLMEKAGSLIGMLSGGMGGMIKKAGGIFSTIGKFIGIGGKGSLIKNVGSVLARLVTSPVKMLLGGGRLLGTVGKVGFTAARIAAAVAMPAITSLGSLALSAGGALLGAIGGIISSPVVLGAAAIAAVGYAAYKGYQYATRDNTDKFQDIRIKQYGLTNSESDKKYNHHILQLEEYLSENAISFRNKEPYLVRDKVDPQEMLSIFDIDKNDKDGIDAFNSWFNGRFKPFFLTSIAALRAVDNKTKLPKVCDLKTEQQLQYLKLIGFESGPYDLETSPFKDLPKLNTGKDLAISAINKLIEELNEKAKSTGKKQEKPVPPVNKPDGSTGKKEEPTAPAATTPPSKPEANTAPVNPKPNDLSNQLNTEPPKSVNNSVPILDTGTGEEGKEPPATNNETGSVTGTPGKVPLANGPVKDGYTAGQYIKLQPGVKLEGLNPELLKNFKGMAQEYGEITGKSIIVTSGARSKQEQEALFKKNPKKAAPPGRSLHEFGLALDVNSADLNEMEKHGLMKKYGFTRPVGGEPWHTEPAGIQVNPAKAKQDSAFAEQAIAASLFKGGGGAGTIPNMPLGKRDTALAVNLLTVPGDKVTSDKDKVKESLLAKSPEANKPEASNDKQYTAKPTLAIDNTKTTADKTAVISPANIGNKIDQANKYSMNDKMVNPDSVKPSVNTASTTDINGNTATKPFDTSGKHGDVKKIIEESAKKVGTDPAMMTTFAALESGLNPNAKASTSSATGLFQFIKSTWNQQLSQHGQKYGLSKDTSPTDPVASSLLGSEYVKANSKYLEKVKPNPNINDLYLAHFLGGGGARKFLTTSPEEYGSRVFPEAANANKSIFFEGGMPLTISQIYKKIEAKVRKAAQSYGISLPNFSSDLTATKPKDNKEQTAGTTPAGDSNKTASAAPAGDNKAKPSVPETAKINPSSPSDITKGSLDTASVNNNNTNIQNQTNIKPVKQVEFFKPQQDTVMSSAPSIASQPSKVTDNFNSGINTVSDTMVKSLGVQEQMLDVLRQILTNVNPENLNAFKESLNKNQKGNDRGGYLDRGPALRQIPDPIVDMRRRQV